MNIQKHPLTFLFMPFCISRIMNAKKISKFEREVKSNGNTLLPHRIFSFTSFFLWTRRKIPYSFFLCPVSISRIMNAKQNSKFEREVKRNGNSLLPHTFFFSFTRLFLWALRKIPYYFFSCAVSICTVMNAKKSPNEQYFLGFSWKFPDFWHCHLIFASTKF